MSLRLRFKTAEYINLNSENISAGCILVITGIKNARRAKKISSNILVDEIHFLMLKVLIELINQ